MNMDLLLDKFLNNEISKQKWLCLTISWCFFAWTFFDYANDNPLTPLFFIFRFLIFGVSALTVTSINKKFFNRKHNVITSTIITFITTSNILFIVSSDNIFYHSTFQVICYFALPSLFLTEKKYFFPTVIVPLIVYTIMAPFGIKSLLYSSIGAISLIGISALTLVANTLNYRNDKKAKEGFDELEMSKDSVAALLTENNQLIRILCHDLGNALAIVEMSSNLLNKTAKKMEEIPLAIPKNIDRIKRAVNTQRELIEHIKQKEALDSGKYEIQLEAVNTNIVFDKVKFIFQKQLSDKKVELIINNRDEHSQFVAAELISLSNNVINNIVSNAIKFSHDNAEIHINSWSDHKNIFITIEDFGIGMNEELAQDIFKPNVKTSRPGVNGEMGTGFGIPLAKSFMLKYGGDIFVESKEGKGTRFTLMFQPIDCLEETMAS